MLLTGILSIFIWDRRILGGNLFLVFLSFGSVALFYDVCCSVSAFVCCLAGVGFGSNNGERRGASSTLAIFSPLTVCWMEPLSQSK